MSFTDQFTNYDECSPPGVRLPELDIEDKYYKVLGLDVSVDNFSFLKSLAEKNLQEKSFANISVYKKRLNSELKILKELGFIDYILLNWDVINYCKENSIPTGPGRGSAAGSLVLFLIGVTKVDPIKYDLFFERFVSKSRAKVIEKNG